MPNHLANATLEAGEKVYGRAVRTDLQTEILSVDSNGIVQLGAGVSGVNAATLKIGGTTIASTATEIDAVADLSAYAQAVTATADGLTTGIVTGVGVDQFVVVTSANAAHLVTLPTPTPGRRVTLDVGANGYKLRSSTPASIAINGGTGASASSTIAANSTVFAICVSATAWKVTFWDADSDVAKVTAAA
jgi:hypothetical protein